MPWTFSNPWPKLGITGIIAPREYEGVGLGYMARTIVLEEMARICAAVAMGMQVHHMAIAALNDFGTEAQKRSTCPLARGRNHGVRGHYRAFGGSDILGMQSTAALKGDTWILNGRKCFITNSHTSDFWLVLARTGGGPQRSHRLHG